MNQVIILGIRPDCVQEPKNPVPPGYRPPMSTEYRVRDGDSWSTVARTHDMAVWDLIVFNFPALSSNLAVAAKEVNWYLQEYVGCRKTTPDKKNYLFHSSAQPGIIFVPKKASACESTVMDSLNEFEPGDRTQERWR